MLVIPVYNAFVAAFHCTAHIQHTVQQAIIFGIEMQRYKYTVIFTALSDVIHVAEMANLLYGRGHRRRIKHAARVCAALKCE